MRYWLDDGEDLYPLGNDFFIAFRIAVKHYPCETNNLILLSWSDNSISKILVQWASIR